MMLEKGEFAGALYEGDTLLGLWFANHADAENRMRIMAIIGAQKALKGRETSLEDFAAATNGLCEIRPAPEQIGGFVLMFPSVSGH